MQFAEIKSLKDLEIILNEASKSGFNLNLQSWRIHDSKLDNIITKVNTLNLNCDYDKLRKLYKDRYAQFEADVQKHFSQFGLADKLKELSRHLNIDSKHCSQDHKVSREASIAAGFIPNNSEYSANNYWEAIDLSVNPTKIKFRCAESFYLNQIFKALGFDFEARYYRMNSSNFDGWEADGFKMYKNGNFTIANPEMAKALLEMAKLRYLTEDCYLVKQ